MYACPLSSIVAVIGRVLHVWVVEGGGNGGLEWWDTPDMETQYLCHVFMSWVVDERNCWKRKSTLVYASRRSHDITQ